MRRLLFLPALLLLTACGTPQEQCIARNTRDLRTVEKLITETEGNLARGYAIEEYTVYVPQWEYCDIQPEPPAEGEKPERPRLCLDERAETRTRPKAIDLDAEAAKLQSLRTKRTQLTRAAESVIAQCKAQYPE